MNNAKLRIFGCLAGLAGMLSSAGALAQAVDAPAAAAPAAPPEPAAASSTGGSAQLGMALPGAAPQAAAAVAGNSDHDAVVGRLAIGYMGRNGVAIAGGLAPVVIDAPVIGVRYWLSEKMGIDAGVGFGFTSGSTDDAAGVSTDNPSWHLFMIHGGLPLSLASAGHFSFQVIPELNLGFAGASATVGGVDASTSGFHLDLGARAGAEIHFGFIDVPQLSLQGSIGARINLDSTGISPGQGGSSNFSFATTVGDNPWNIFTSNVAALYYF